MKRKRIVVAMSGGVDSSVAAALLQSEGHEVIGVTLRLKPPEPTSAIKDPVVDAQVVADHLGIPLCILDRAERFRDMVLRPSWEEYARGRTPNPCVLCNPSIKFDALLEVARAEGAEWVATGHYARVSHEPGTAPVLLRAKDRAKDQSYFLFALTPPHLARVIFPLGDLTKVEVRGIARERGLPSADRVESQDACVVGMGERLPDYLCTLFGEQGRPGAIVATDGSSLGTHDGFHRLTIGQRRGIGVAVGVPAWVKAIDPVTGTVTMVTEPDDLLASGLHASGMTWHGPPPGIGSFPCMAQVRYGHHPIRATVEPGAHGSAAIHFETPVRAVTPGQAVVLYDNDAVLGGGWIRDAVQVRG
ncbi:MAG: tRNA 2-thiouridine(34) synthase MnmA [Candidatus Eisenbacteria bacterium]|jgi:tRNA-specific 2-thiouridylase|nr:tRNA 2-thiouridine(34) synthase MnmA [Candidatus Eisenbacteria bacterium]